MNKKNILYSLQSILNDMEFLKDLTDAQMLLMKQRILELLKSDLNFPKSFTEDIELNNYADKKQFKILRDLIEYFIKIEENINVNNHH